MTNLDRFKDITHLYLQHNNITRIEGLEYLPSLRFLILAHNEITQIEGVDECWELRLLDLSHNQIEHFDAEMLPPDIAYILLADNHCARLPAYRLELIQRLEDLIEIDEEPVTTRERDMARNLRPAAESRGDDGDRSQAWRSNVDEVELYTNDLAPNADKCDGEDEDDVSVKAKYDAALAAIVHRSRVRQAEGLDERYAEHIAKLKLSLLNRHQ
ncbi:hypothetical protein HDU86_000411 [Geranomyces michiganensis]|nr:hypothetical protein HDU86_000411 [Geranomyces michiganensis]